MVRRRFKPVRRLGCLILIAGLCIAAYFALDFFRGWTGEGPTEKDRTVVIAEGSTLTAAAREIEEDGAITSARAFRSEEHTSELQSLMRISYAVFCLKNNKY